MFVSNFIFFYTSKCATYYKDFLRYTYDAFIIKRFWSYEGRKAGHLAQIQPKYQFLFHKHLPPRDFSLMILPITVDSCRFVSNFVAFLENLNFNLFCGFSICFFYIFRKQLATSIQMLNLTENEIESVANFMVR